MSTPRVDARRTVAVMFGGRSLEHDVSVVSGLQILHALDPAEFAPMPVYIDQDERFWIGDPLWSTTTFAGGGPDRSRLTEVTLEAGFGSSALVSRATMFRCPRRVPVDIFLPVMHGTFGEDGSLQGLLELSGSAYVGCGVLAAAIGMNKRVTKVLASQAGVPVVPWLSCDRAALAAGPAWIESLIAEVEQGFGWPVIVKPCNLGSSAGVSVAATRDELAAGVLNVFDFDNEALIEPFIKNRLEVNVAVAGLEQPVASVTEMPVTALASPLSFSEKYKRPGRKNVGTSEGMAAALRILDPLQLPAEMRAQAQQLATSVFALLGCEGIARIDFLIDADSDQLYFNEINTMPGSFAYYLWSAAPHYWTITELLSRLLRRAEMIRATKLGYQRHPPAELRLLT